jgi:hypothetical protein
MKRAVTPPLAEIGEAHATDLAREELGAIDKA